MLFSSQEHEHPFNIDVELLYGNRSKTPTVKLVDSNGTFCECGCGPNHFSSTMVINDLDRRLAARISLNIKNELNSTLEIRGITPLDFSGEKIIEAYNETFVSCDLAYGFFHSKQNNISPYTPMINVKPLKLIIPDPHGDYTVEYYDTDYIQADKATIKYSNSFFNIESNYWLHLTPRWVNYFSVSYGFGLRYFYYADRINANFFKDPNQSDFSSRTKNHLIGGQALLDFHIHPYTWLDWGIRLDGGALVTHLRLDFELNDLDGQDLLARYSKQKINYGFFGDLEVFLMVKFLNRAYAMGSYGGTLIHGMAQAMPNINLTTKNFGIYSQGNVLYQYWTLGLGWDF